MNHVQLIGPVPRHGNRERKSAFKACRDAVLVSNGV